MARCSLFKKKPKLGTDGCRSNCANCQTLHICGGCTGICDFDSRGKGCPDGFCDKCPTRCWRRYDLDEWELDIDGFELDNVKCGKVYDGDLPVYLPQARENIWNIYHPAYVINIAKILNPRSGRLTLLSDDRLRKQWQIPKESKLILSFCCKDDVIEDIWERQFEDWYQGRNFWQTISLYKFDAVISVDYSCFLNYPRFDHIVNIKRNALSAQRLALSGIPVILDIMVYNLFDLVRFVTWGRDQGFKYFHLNFQKTFDVLWMRDIIIERCDKVFEIVPDAKVILSGIGDMERIKYFVSRYAGRVSLSSANISIHSKCGRLYDIDTGKWRKTNLPHRELFQRNLKIFT